MSGGDWNDASVDHILVPEGVNLEEQKDKYLEWLNARNTSSLGGIEYRTFGRWLIDECGAKEDESVEEFWGL